MKTMPEARTDQEMVSDILNCICPQCGGPLDLGEKEFRCQGRCRQDWRPLWERASAAENSAPAKRSRQSRG